MAYSGTKIETWNRSTPRDGLLLDSEFSQLYDDIENYISGNSGAEPPYTLKELADGTVTFAGAKTFSSKITGNISGHADGDVALTGAQTIAGVKTFSSTIVGSIDSIKETGSGAGTLRKKIIEIGDWNMDSSNTCSVNHGLTASKIRNVSILIRGDTDSIYANAIMPLNFSAYATNQEATNGDYYVNATIVLMSRLISGFYDSADFDSTSFNRGWITIEYVD